MSKSLETSLLSVPKKSLAAYYLELCKPKVVALMLLTAMVGMFLAKQTVPNFMVLCLATLGIGLCAASGAAINHIIDQHLDAIMARTKKRPLPVGGITTTQALIFALGLLASGMFILFYYINALTATLTFATFIGYAIIYTWFLKHWTVQNIVIGGLAGAMPPLLGWTAMVNQVSAFPLLLVLIIFIWTPPHFWALAIFRFRDYQNAKIPMMPVIYGISYTKLHILLYSLLLAAITLLPYACRITGNLYLFGALLLNARFLYLAIKLFKSANHNIAMHLFRYTIFYLMLLFMLLLLDHYI